MQEPKEDQRSGPLSDLKVLDLAGPIGVYCAKLMADLGADVVRIEPPKGDSMREIGPFLMTTPTRKRASTGGTSTPVNGGSRWIWNSLKGKRFSDVW